jgi:hypothetical protein
MKDFEAKYEERWEVIEEYCIKELEKNLVQHRTDERIMRYKLETYQKNFLDFICGSPTSTNISLGWRNKSRAQWDNLGGRSTN